jgi:hypothetical protein
MKTLLTTTLLFAAASPLAFAKKNHRAPSSTQFETDCNEMRMTVAVLTQNLISVNATSMKLLEQTGKKPEDTDFKVLDASLRALANELDALTAKVNKTCK